MIHHTWYIIHHTYGIHHIHDMHHIHDIQHPHHNISYHIIWYDIISYDIISYDMIRNHKIRYVMMIHDMLWWHMVQQKSFFLNCSAMLEICLGIVTGHFEAGKNLYKKKNNNNVFQKLFIDLWAMICYHHWVFFWKGENIFLQKNIFSHYYVLFSCIFKDK